MYMDTFFTNKVREQVCACRPRLDVPRGPCDREGHWRDRVALNARLHSDPLQHCQDTRQDSRLPRLQHNKRLQWHVHHRHRRAHQQEQVRDRQGPVRSEAVAVSRDAGQSGPGRVVHRLHREKVLHIDKPRQRDQSARHRRICSTVG